jgi:hypothetical protein
MLADFARKLSPWGHARFQRWCVPAVVGDLPPEQVTELEKHLRGCVKCRRFVADTAQSSLAAMPGFWEKRKPVVVRMMPPEGMRERFLQRLNCEEEEQEETGSLVELKLPLGTRPPREVRPGDPALAGRRSSGFKMLVQPVRFAAFLIAISLFVGGYYAGSKSKLKAAAPSGLQVVPMLENRTIQANVAAPPDTNKKVLQSILDELKRTRTLAAAERHALDEKLAASEARLASLQRDYANTLQQSQETDREAKEVLAASRKENEALRKRITETEAILATQDRRTQQLQNELQTARGHLQDQDDQRAAADQQLAKGQLSDLVTARNLHIVDVYDADGGGQRRASFGRVFYVEGKSLLFYAYDLQDTRQAKANVVFRVWGGRVGTKEVTHSLGILRNEDARQGLWTMTFDDPSILAEINSVFVTAESASRRDLLPHGKKVLYAYLGNPPNHP